MIDYEGQSFGSTCKEETCRFLQAQKDYQTINIRFLHQCTDLQTNGSWEALGATLASTGFHEKNQSSFLHLLYNEEHKKILGKHIVHVKETAFLQFWEKKLFSLILMLESADYHSNIVPFIVIIIRFPFLVLIFLPGRYDILCSWVSLRVLFYLSVHSFLSCPHFTTWAFVMF